MFGRRVPPHLVFVLSLVLAALCGVWAFAALRAHSWGWGTLAALLAVWFAVDALRSYGWARTKKRLDAENRAQNHPNLK